MWAALIYQRATREADRLIADRMSDLVGDRTPDDDDPDKGDNGAAGALVSAPVNGPSMAYRATRPDASGIQISGSCR